MERHEQQNAKAYQTIFQHGSRYSKPLATTEAESAGSVPYTSAQVEYSPSARTTSSQGPSILAPGHSGGPSTPSPRVASAAFPMSHLLSPLYIPQQSSSYVPDLYTSASVASSPYSSSSSQSTLSPYPGGQCPQEPYGVSPRHGSVSSTHAIDPALCPSIRTPISAQSTYEAWAVAQSPQVLSSPHYDVSYYQPVGSSTFRQLSQERTQNLPASAVPFPHLDEHTWPKLRSMAVGAAGAAHPGQEGSSVDLEKANLYLQNYWQRFDTSHPVVHRSTFSVSSNILLTAVMVAIGAQYVDDWRAKAFASRLHRGFMKALANMDITSASPIPDIQAAILSEMFSRLRSKKIDVQASPEFRKLYKSLLEDQHGQDAISTAAQNLAITQDVPSKWKLWVELETRRRLVLSAFMWDVQQAVRFKQGLCDPSMDSAAIGLYLPCPMRVWACNSPDEWVNVRSLAPRESLQLSDFVEVLTSTNQQLQPLEEFPSALTLTSLMSIAIAIDREESDHVITVASTSEKRKNLENSYQSWWHSYINDSGGSNSTATTRIPRDPGTLLMYHMSLLTLHTDIRDLLTVAGESFVFGQKRQEADYLQAKRDLRSWAKIPSAAAKSAWHASKILRIALSAAEKTTMTLNMHWCMYIAGLVCWAYGYAHTIHPSLPLPQPPSPPTGETSTPTTAWPYLEATNTQSWEELDAVEMRCKTTGLLVHVRTVLEGSSTHGECQLLSEGAQVLRRLSEGRSKFCRF
ncbi:MAG: hypothetical protein M1813_005200 [Trichoglossum hirsutum]|nr:MAG: hypothetical protein M1813_005200 [Trichoglossum hirsutum]